MTPRGGMRRLTEADATRRNEGLRANHRRMLAAAKSAGVPVLSISPPVNWRDAPTGSPFALNRTAFVEGWIALLRGEAARSIELWKASLDEPDAPDAGMSRSLTAFWMAKASERLGRQKEANALYERAMDEDWVTVGRCGPRCSKVLRESAAEGGAAWLDLDAKFRAQTAPRLPGLDMFCDEVHWLRGWDAFAAVQVIEAIAALPSSKDLPWDKKALAALRAEAARKPPLTELDAMETLRYAMSSMDRPDAMLSSRALTFLETVHERRPAWFADLEGAAARAAADGQGRGAAWGMPALHPSIPKLYWYSGVVVMRRAGAKASLPFFAKALSLDSSLKGARVARAIAFSLSGRKAEAENELIALSDDDQVRADARAVADALGVAR
jgi:tetratricopeptide (TPR) repeat protein